MDQVKCEVSERCGVSSVELGNGKLDLVEAHKARSSWTPSPTATILACPPRRSSSSYSVSVHRVCLVGSPAGGAVVGGVLSGWSLVLLLFLLCVDGLRALGGEQLAFGAHRSAGPAGGSVYGCGHRAGGGDHAVELLSPGFFSATLRCAPPSSWSLGVLCCRWSSRVLFSILPPAGRGGEGRRCWWRAIPFCCRWPWWFPLVVLRRPAVVARGAAAGGVSVLVLVVLGAGAAAGRRVVAGSWRGGRGRSARPDSGAARRMDSAAFFTVWERLLPGGRWYGVVAGD